MPTGIALPYWAAELSYEPVRETRYTADGLLCRLYRVWSDVESREEVIEFVCGGYKFRLWRYQYEMLTSSANNHQHVVSMSRKLGAAHKDVDCLTRRYLDRGRELEEIRERVALPGSRVRVSPALTQIGCYVGKLGTVSPFVHVLWDGEDDPRPIRPEALMPAEKMLVEDDNHKYPRPFGRKK